MGGLDDRPPKIIMLNNKQSLKATLSKKAAEIGPATDIAPVVSHARTTAAELPLTVTISIAVPLADAARYLEQLQQFLHAPNTAALPAEEPQQPPVNMQTPTLRCSQRRLNRQESHQQLHQTSSATNRKP